MQKEYKIGDHVIATNIKPLEGNDKAPKLVIGQTYIVKDITLDSHNHQHLDVGLISRLNYVRSWETKEELRNGDKVHWCHPSRFELV